MAADINPTLRAEIEAAIAVILPQIRGLEDIGKVSLSAEAKAIIAEELDDRRRRRDFLTSVISRLDDAVNAMARLEGDGYPQMSKGELPPDLFAEIQGQRSDFDAAFGELVEQPPVSGGDVTLTQFQDVPAAP